MHENLFAHTAEVMRLHLAKMNNSLIIFTFLNTFPTTHFKFVLIIINALLFMRVAINEKACEKLCNCDVRCVQRT